MMTILEISAKCDELQKQLNDLKTAVQMQVDADADADADADVYTQITDATPLLQFVEDDKLKTPTYRKLVSCGIKTFGDLRQQMQDWSIVYDPRIDKVILMECRDLLEGYRTKTIYKKVDDDTRLRELYERGMLSVRSTNALLRSGIETIGQMREAVLSGECTHLRNFGKRSLAECKEVLRQIHDGLTI